MKLSMDLTLHTVLNVNTVILKIFWEKTIPIIMKV